MAEQVRGPFEKFVDSPYLKKRLSLHLHEVPTRSNKARTHLITPRVLKITPLLPYPTTTTWHNSHRFPLRNSGALPPVHGLCKRHSYDRQATGVPSRWCSIHVLEVIRCIPLNTGNQNGDIPCVQLRVCYSIKINLPTIWFRHSIKRIFRSTGRWLMQYQQNEWQLRQMCGVFAIRATWHISLHIPITHQSRSTHVNTS